MCLNYESMLSSTSIGQQNNTQSTLNRAGAHAQCMRKIRYDTARALHIANATFSHCIYQIGDSPGLCIKFPTRQHTNKCYVRFVSAFRCAMPCEARSIFAQMNIEQWDGKECMFLTEYGISLCISLVTNSQEALNCELIGTHCDQLIGHFSSKHSDILNKNQLSFASHW